MTPFFDIISNQFWFQETQNASTEGIVSPPECGV